MNKFIRYLLLIISFTCSGLLLLANEEQPLDNNATINQTLNPSDNNDTDDKNSKDEMPKEEKSLLERTKFFAKGLLYSCVSLASCFGALKA